MKPTCFSNSIAIYIQNALRNKFNNLLASYLRNKKLYKGVLSLISIMNKKIIFSLFLVFALTSFVSAQSCSDSDGGLNYNQWGSVFGDGSSYDDKCSYGQGAEPYNNSRNYLFEAYCFQDKDPSGEFGYGYEYYYCPNGCNAGACINSCTDSDGGKDVLVVGQAGMPGTSGQGDWCDYSKGENKIQEAYCINNTAYATELMDCPSDKPYCNKGKCTTEKPQCTEDDGGKNPLVKGTTFPSRIADHTGSTDYCQITSTGQPPANGRCSGSDCSLREFYCSGGPDESYTDIPCSSGCSDGVCEGAVIDSIPCVDSDGGLNYFTKSEATGAAYLGGVSVSEVDTCMDGNTLREGYCNEKGFVLYKDHSCLNGCLNGKCIKSEGLTCSVDATKCNLEWTELTCGEVVLSPSGFDEYCNLLSPLGGSAGFNFENDGCSKAVLCVYGCNNGVCLKGETITPTDDPKEIPQGNESTGYFCKGCELEDKCYPFGYRKVGQFCSDTGSFVKQLEGDNVCDNNFECSSNVCVSGKCIDEGFIQKILNWFKRLFGGN
jgi:hypothetical protein